MKPCSACLYPFSKDGYSKNQWNNKPHERRCKGCIDGNVGSRPNAIDIMSILSMVEKVETEGRPHADVPEEALNFVEVVGHTIDLELYQTRGHGLLQQCIEMKITPGSSERSIGIIAGFRNENGSATVDDSTLFKVVFVDLNAVGVHQREYMMYDLMSPELGIEAKDVLTDGLQTALVNNWVDHVVARPYPAIEKWEDTGACPGLDLDEDGFVVGAYETPLDLGLEIEGDSVPMDIEDEEFDPREDMRAKAQKARKVRGEAQFGGVGVGHCSSVFLDPEGGGVIGTTKHGVSAQGNKKKNYILACDLTILPKSQWDEETLQALEKDEKEGKLGENEVARGYTVEEGNREYIEDLLHKQKVSLMWAPDFKDWKKVDAALHKMHRPDEANKSEGLFVNTYVREGKGGAATSGRNSRRTLSIIERHEPFKTFLRGIKKNFSIRQCWVLANVSGEHGFHQDSFQHGATHRMIVTLGSEGKVMWFMEPKSK